MTSALAYLSCDQDTLVLDPWGGSGTTSLVAARESIPSLCIEINPVMATFAAAKSPRIFAMEQGIRDFFEHLVPAHVSHELQPGFDSDPLAALFEPTTASLIRAVGESIPFRADLLEHENQIPEPVGSVVRDESLLIGTAYAFCMAVIFVTAREYSETKRGSNPTWLKANHQKVSVNPGRFLQGLQRNAQNMLNDLHDSFGDTNNARENFSICADVRQLPLKSGVIPRIITSPPYLTRIDYAVSTSPEMSMFGGEALIRFVRDRSMGAPVITDAVKRQREHWGALCNQLLDAIKSHETKAAASYYWKNIVQYFMDTDAALDEIVRVLAPGGCGLIVVQSSYFKDVELPLGEIYVQMARNKGLVANIARREEVRGHMAHVNTKSSIYKRDKVYFEDFVYVEKTN